MDIMSGNHKVSHSEKKINTVIFIFLSLKASNLKLKVFFSFKYFSAVQISTIYIYVYPTQTCMRGENILNFSFKWAKHTLKQVGPSFHFLQ